MQKTLWFIWSAMVYSILIYLGVAYFLVRSTSAASPEFVPAFAIFTIFLALLSVGMSIVIRMKLLSGPMQEGKLDLASPQGMQKYQTISIISWALDETIAIFGLVLVVISGVFYYAIPYCVVSLVLLALHRPSVSN
jgi:hypothetical protein